MNPESKKEQLLAQTVGDELVVYDQQTHTAHRLNKTAALVWRLADGRRSTADLAKLLHDAVDAPEDEDLVRLALGELDKSGLLLSALPKADEPFSRRRLFSIGATLIPVVASVGVPSAQSCTSSTAPTTPVITIISPSAVGGVYQTTQVTVSFSSSCASRFEYRLDGAPAVSTTGPVTLTGLAPGPHTITAFGFNGTFSSPQGSLAFSTALPASSSSSSGFGSSSSTSSSNSSSSSSSSSTSSSGGGFATQTYDYLTNAERTFVVPAGVTSIFVDAYGAQGGAGASGSGGALGGRAEGRVTVIPGETLRIIAPSQGLIGIGGWGGGYSIGNGGDSMSDGGGGGGAAMILRGGSPGTPGLCVFVAGGGGGGGSSNSAGLGGAGGGATAGNGANGLSAGGGGGGSQSLPGTGGTSPTGSSGQSSFGNGGGIGASGTAGSGGGGGGGYLGGGGGAGTNSGGSASGGGGGGGGSSFSDGASVTHSQGVRSGHGRIVISP